MTPHEQRKAARKAADQERKQAQAAARKVSPSTYSIATSEGTK